MKSGGPRESARLTAPPILNAGFQVQMNLMRMRQSGVGESDTPRTRGAAALLASTLLLLLALTSCGSGAQAANPSNSPSPAGMAAVDGSQMPRLPRAPAARSGSNPVPVGAMSEQQFATLVFNDIQSFWSREFSKAGTPYQPAQLVTFNGGVETGCGAHPSEVGPFYCPPDHTVYIDLSFLTALQQYIGAEGDFARAYIIAHELGHHVQTVVGITTRVNALSAVSPNNANPLSVRSELQADCLAGVWAATAYSRNLIGPSQINEALRAAAAVGDDYQQQLAGVEMDDTGWTHGSSAQRQHWLQTGIEQGRPDACDTFSSSAP
jgi:predicted metalloprotease